MAVDFTGTPVFIFFLTLISTLALILGALAWSRASSLSLPLPIWIPGMVTLLSPLTATAAAFTEISDTRPTDNTNTRTRTRIMSIIDQLHSMLLTAIATVALTYLFPENILSCHLEQQWQSYFQAKNAEPIRAIQDNFQCCGLRSIRDRAWPFKDRTHRDDTCEVQLGYHRSCFVPWREQQQAASWMVLAAAVLVWGVKIGIVQFSRRQPSWMNGFASRRAGARAGEYQRITHPAVTEEAYGGDDVEDTAAGTGRAARATLPPSSAPYPNEWEDR